MKKYLLVFFAGCMSLTGLVAQNINRCATDQHNAWLEANDPSYAIQRQLIDQQVQQYIQQHAGQKGALVTIPVVFHILYANANQNISNAQIFAQMDQLNLDYFSSNPDTATVPAVFKSYIAQAQIQFCLAKRDPNNQATDGIVRKSTTVSSWSTNNAIKSSASGGSDAWDRNKYLNLWVGNLGSGLLGYAQFPGGSAATDGVVIHYGTVGSALKPATFNWGANYNWGRSATHEIGHWLGLRHTFEGGCTNTNCNTQGDLICDTPPVSGPSFGCPNFPKISCSNGPNGGMFMNFMDYVDDNCMKLFSDSQGVRMNAILNSTRASLKTSLGCVPVGIDENNPTWQVATYPNPAGDYMNISITGTQYEKLEIALVEATGKTVLNRQVATVPGTLKYQLDVSGQPAGLYVLHIAGEDGALRKKVTLMR